MTDLPLIQVIVSPTFNRNLRTLAKKYRSIRNDIQPVIEQLAQDICQEIELLEWVMQSSS